jgi:hypothetical protein
MSFIHGYLLGGLLLIGVPLLLHLIARQRPKVLRFPAFRFLQQRARTNRRKLRLQHLLLLLLRMALIAGLCLALARPRLMSGAWSFSTERPVNAVLVIDTSMSMDYRSGDITRLDDAKQRARELIQEMAEGSQVVVLDPAEDAAGSDWLPAALALSRLEALRARPAATAVNRAVDRGFRLLADRAQGEDAPPRFLYVFSDRTRSSWDSLRPNKPDGTHAVFVDLGVGSPRDLAIDRIEIDPPQVHAGTQMRVVVTLRATGGDFDTEVSLQVLRTVDLPEDVPGIVGQPERRAVKLAAGESVPITFELTAPRLEADGPRDQPFQLRAQVVSNDALPFNNVRQATFVVRERHKVLTLVGAGPEDETAIWFPWKLAIKEGKLFDSEVRPLAGTELSLAALQAYPVVCLFQVSPDEKAWKVLEDYVTRGGGLVVVPGGEAWQAVVASLNLRGGALLPAPFTRAEKVPPAGKAIRWLPFDKRHPITGTLAKFVETSPVDFGPTGDWPAVYAYWATGKLADGAVAVASLAEKDTPPVVLERPVGKGKVIQLASPFDFRLLDSVRKWDNYHGSSFGFVFIGEIYRYLGGETTAPDLNFLCGQPVVVAAQVGSPPYVLRGGDLTGPETRLQPPDQEGRLTVPQATIPGNFVAFDSKKRVAAGFSLNVRQEESQLEKVAVEEIEPVLGKGSVLQVGRSINLQDALQGLQPPPVELLPFFLMALLLALALEAFLANRFYRQPAPDAAAAPVAPVRNTA